MLLLVGLGNPGTEYVSSRHNIGFMVADRLVRHYSFSAFKDKLKGQISTGEIDGQKSLLLKPTTFMNLSGESVLATTTFYKLTPENIIVFHDDLDLPVGKVKVKRGGSAGGHNGLKSIDSAIGPDYLRVRIGIGRPLPPQDTVSWVLGSFSAEDRAVINTVLDAIMVNLPLLLKGDDQTFMNRLNQK